MLTEKDLTTANNRKQILQEILGERNRQEMTCPTCKVEMVYKPESKISLEHMACPKCGYKDGVPIKNA